VHADQASSTTSRLTVDTILLLFQLAPTNQIFFITVEIWRFSAC
jgi:hypothetical protein